LYEREKNGMTGRDTTTTPSKKIRRCPTKGEGKKGSNKKRGKKRKGRIVWQKSMPSSVLDSVTPVQFTALGQNSFFCLLFPYPDSPRIMTYR
jgi:hypothetical protein